MKWFVLALVFFACAEASEELPLYAAPARPRATLVLEPPIVAVGQLAELELAVVTKPGHSVAPKDLPGKLAGFWLVERESPEVVKEPARWVHRTLLRLRAVEVGRFEFPGGSVEVESPEGGSAVLHYDALPLEVTSILADHPTQQSPYGIRMLPLSKTSARGSVGAFAAGAVLALASVGMVLLVRRRLSARESVDRDARESSAPAWVVARGQLEQARSALDADTRGAVDMAARALRGYAVRRFGGDASVRTTEELAVSKPPFTMTTRWVGFVEILAALDAARFPPAAADRAAAAALLDRVAGFVDESVPVESRE